MVLLQSAALDLGRSDQVDGDVMLVDLHVWVFPDRLHQGPLDFTTGNVLGMQDTSGTVAALAGQVVALATGGEFDPPFDQVADGLRAFLHHHSHHIFPAYAGASHQCVINMGIEGILG